MVPRL